MQDSFKNYFTVIFMCSIGGFFFTLGFPNILFGESLGPIFPLIGIAIFFFHILDINCSLNSKPRMVLLSLISFSLSVYAFGLNWIPTSIFDFTNTSLLLSHSIGILIGLFFLSQFWFFLGLKWIVKVIIIKSGNHTAQFFDKLNGSIVVNALLLCWIEFFVLRYFPVHCGLTWGAFAPNLGLAPVIGSVGFSFYSIYCSLKLQKMVREKRVSYSFLISFSLFISINYFLRLPITQNNQFTGETIIKLVQGNIDRFDKKDAEEGRSESIYKIYDVYRKLSLSGSSSSDLIIWPETTYPNRIQSSKIESGFFHFPEFIQEIVNKSNSALLFGATDMMLKDDDTTYSNSAILVQKDLKFGGIYKKNKLMPIGEELPIDSLYSLFNLEQNMKSRLRSGKGPFLFQLPNGAKFISIICFESLFPDLISDYLDQSGNVDYIVNISNDSWFRGTIQPAQNFYFAKWIAMEFGVHLIRVASTGITGVIKPDGTILASAAPDNEAYLDVALPIHKEKSQTLFQRVGFIAVILLALILQIFEWLEMQLIPRKRTTE